MKSLEIEIQILKSQLEMTEQRIRFLESNWLTWTKNTNEIGRQVVAALLEKVNDGHSGKTDTPTPTET